MDAGAAASVVVVALLVGEVRDSGVGWLLWPLGRRGGRCFGERWRFEGGACVPGAIPCSASVGPRRPWVSSPFLKASSRLLIFLDVALGENHPLGQALAAL